MRDFWRGRPCARDLRRFESLPGIRIVGEGTPPQSSRARERLLADRLRSHAASMARHLQPSPRWPAGRPGGSAQALESDEVNEIATTEFRATGKNSVVAIR